MKQDHTHSLATFVNMDHIKLNNSPTHFGDLASELDSIYNTYNDRGSTETLDSVRDRAPIAPQYRMHLQKKLEKAQTSSNGSSPGISRVSSMVSSEEDFNFNATPHPNTNTLMQVLVDSQVALGSTLNKVHTDDALEVEDIVSEQDAIGEVEDVGQGSEDEIKMAPAAIAKQKEWNERGAAQKEISSGEVTRVVRRGVLDFKFGRTLGEGAYSTVVLAKDKHTNVLYAVKVLNKRHITKEKKVRYVNIEKNALNRLADRMGIIQLYFTFQDEESLYFVLSYALRGELLSLLKKHGSLNEDCVRHFGAQILDAIRYMHDNGVIHRDIKPENILLDDKLRIQITDFGTARLLEKRSKTPDDDEEYPLDVRAKSFVGTAEYVSPELLESKYCGKPGDVWAFGCIIYQMIAGKPPFQATNEYLTFQKITKLQYAFSAGFPNIVRDLIKQILVLQPAKRAKIPQIQKHFFFQSVDFDNFEQIWESKVPEIGPYKMSARSMMKVPESASPSPAPAKKYVKRPTPAQTNSTTSVNGKQKVSAASVAAYVLRAGTEGSESDDTPSPAPPSRVSSRASVATTASTNSNDYIPGTNILRPTINTRSFSRAAVPKKKPAQPAKPKIMEVTPISQLETMWESFLTHPDERIIRIGAAYVQRESTDSFEKRNKGLLYNSPLGLAAKLQQLNGSKGAVNSRGSLLSQVVNGSTSGLRGSAPSVDEPSSENESEAITEFLEEPSSTKEASSSHSTKHRSILKKFRLSSTGTQDDSTEKDEPKYALEKQKTCTVIVTTHGRVLILMRQEGGEGANGFKLLCEIKVAAPIVQFKEVVGSNSKFQKIMPTTGIFAIESSQTTFVFEVEKYEVSLWTDALARAKVNQLEREKADSEDITPTGSSKDDAGPSPKPDNKSPTNVVEQPKPTRTAELARVNKTAEAPKKSAERSRSPTTPVLPQLPLLPEHGETSPREVHSPKDGGMMSAKFRLRTNTRRKPPPRPNSPPSNPSALPSDSGLHAALLAVAHGQLSATTDNRRSSFTKENNNNNNNQLPLLTAKVPNGAVTSKNSKLLARSTRKK